MASVAHYRILGRIGAGGLGDVFRARDTRHGRTVALKVVPPGTFEDSSARTQFFGETRALLPLSHPNIAALYEVGEDAGRLFLAYEFVPGETLRAAMAGRPMHPHVAIDLAASLADALAEAHAHGVVHGDLRPENIMVTPKGHAKILDFGMQAWTWGGAGRRRVARGETRGEMAQAVAPYMSPEQVLGEAVDHRSDIFSLGVLLFEMLTGHAPFRGRGSDDAMLGVLRTTPPPPSALRRDVPPEADVIVAHALHKSLDDRYQGVAAMAADLRQLGAALDIRDDMRDHVPVVARRPGRRSWRGATAAVLLLLLLGAAGWWWQDDAKRRWRLAFGAPPAPIVVVIPDSDDPSRAHLARAFAEDLADRLATIPGLSVLDRSWMHAGETPPRRGAAAGVHVRLSRRGDRFEVDVALHDMEQGHAVWAAQFEEAEEAAFSLQADVAEAVARVLGLEGVSIPVRARAAARRVEPAAYDLYARARAAAARADWPIAIEFYARATTVDESLTEAYAGLAIALHERARATGASGDAALTGRLRQAAARGVTADPDLARAQVAAGLAAGTLSGALDAFRLAMQIDPSGAAAFVAAGDLVAEADPEVALHLYERGAARDRGYPGLESRSAFALLRLGRHELAEARLEQTTGAARAAVQTLIDFDRGRHEAVVDMSFGVTEIGPTPALARVAALRELGREEDAADLAESVALWYPPFCDIDAVAAALRLDLGQRAQALARARAVLAEAGPADAAPALAGCAALAAVGVENATAAATWLRHIADSDGALKAWIAPADSLGRHTWLVRRWYPWNRTPVTPELQDAMEALDAAVARYRAEAASLLAGVLEE